MGRSQRHILVEHNSTSAGEIVAQGEIAPASLIQAGAAPADIVYGAELQAVEDDLFVPIAAPGGPLSGSPLTGAVPGDMGAPDVEIIPPSISSVAPTGAFVGDPDTTVTVTGTGFLADSVIMFNSIDKVTTFVSATDLTTVLPTSTMLPEDSIAYAVEVRNADGGVSNPISFTIGYNIPPLDEEI